MKSFRPIFLSLMKAACEDRRKKSNTFFIHRDTRLFHPLPTETKISAVDWLICPFWTSPSCSREDLRVAHRALMLRVYRLRNPGHSFSPAVSIPTTTHRPAGSMQVYTQMKQTSGLFSHSVNYNRKAAVKDECSLSDAHR